jgi:hypothetical protein
MFKKALTVGCVTFAFLALLLVTFNDNAQGLSVPSTAKFFSVTRSQQSEDNFTFAAKKISISNGKIIGNSFLICGKMPDSGRFGSGVQQCHGTYNLPRGKIAVIGSRNNIDKYSFVVVGGTGFYAGVGGKLDVFRIGASPITERLIFSLIP